MLLRILIIGGLLASAPGNFVFSSGAVFHSQVRINLENSYQRATVFKYNFDIIRADSAFIEIIAGEYELNLLDRLGFDYRVIHENLEEFYRSRLASKTMGGYKTLAEIENSLTSLVVNYPDLVAPALTIGQTIEGRDIRAYKISDNPLADEGEPEIFFNAAIHAREVITPEVLLYYMDYLTENYGSDFAVTYLVDNREIWFVPVANPDGYYHNEVISPWGGGLWRKNRRDNGDGSFGVDLNRNFGYMWGHDDIGSSPVPDNETYRGAGAFSEPETQAIRDFIIARDFSLIVNYHSYGDLVLFPWSYQIGLYCDDDATFDAIGSIIHSCNAYYPSPGWALYPTNGGSDDWCYGDTVSKGRVPSITIEVGSYLDGFWPPEERILPLVTENLPVNLYLTDLADNIRRALPPVGPDLILPEINHSGSYEVGWHCHDPDNPPVAYELIEYGNPVIITDSLNDYENFDNVGFTLTGVGYMATMCAYSGPATTIERYFQTIASYTVKPGDSLKFRTRYVLNQDVDYAYVEVSADGTNFSPIPGNITTMNNPHGYNRGHGITGTTAGFWVAGLFDLADYVGQNVYFRISYRDFHVTAAGSGIRIDNLWPVQTYETKCLISSTLSDTSILISGKSDGIYYYRVRAMDADSQWGAFSPIDSVVVQILQSYLCGDANGDSYVNLIDILCLIDFVYSDPPGSAPDPFDAGDVDGPSGHGQINLIDILYLVSYLYDFPPGPSPVCP